MHVAVVAACMLIVTIVNEEGSLLIWGRLPLQRRCNPLIEEKQERCVTARRYKLVVQTPEKRPYTVPAVQFQQNLQYVLVPADYVVDFFLILVVGVNLLLVRALYALHELDGVGQEGGDQFRR